MTPQNSCAACGQENAPEARFCVTCGSALQSASPPEGGADSAYDMLPPRTAGDILNATLSLYLSAPWAFVGFVGIALVPQIPSTIGALTQGPVSWVLTALGVFVSIFASGATVYAAGRHVLGKEWDIGSAYTRALERVVSLVGAFVVYFLAIVGALILSIVLIGIPLLFFILVVWYFHAQAIMIEGRRNLDALSRSYELVKGNWWRVFGIGVLFIAIAAGVYIVALIPIVIAALVASQSAVGVIIISAVTVLVTPFLVIGGTVVYLDLRVRKENYTLDRLAAELGG